MAGPDEIHYNDNENLLFNRMKAEDTGIFVANDSNEALTVATSAVEGLS